MIALLASTRARVLQLLPGPRSAGLFALPLVLLLLVAGVFRNGDPLERHRVVMDSDALSADEQSQLRAQFQHSDDVRFDLTANRAHAEGLLKTHMVSAVLSREPGSLAVRVLVGPHDVLFGWGLASTLSQRVELAQVQVPRFGYLHFLFPGVLMFAVLTTGLLGMGRAVREYRSRPSPELLASPGSLRSFLASRAVSYALLGALQIAVLVLAARLVFDLPLGFQTTAWVFVIGIVGLVAFSGLGFAVSSWTEGESVTLQVLCAIQLPLLLLSEAAFLLDELPRPWRIIGELLPTTHMIRLLREVLLYGGAPVPRLATGLAVMAGFGAAAFVLGLAGLGRRAPAARAAQIEGAP